MYRYSKFNFRSRFSKNNFFHDVFFTEVFFYNIILKWEKRKAANLTALYFSSHQNTSFKICQLTLITRLILAPVEWPKWLPIGPMWGYMAYTLVLLRSPCCITTSRPPLVYSTTFHSFLPITSYYDGLLIFL